jgi:hypothetical protein
MPHLFPAKPLDAAQREIVILRALESLPEPADFAQEIGAILYHWRMVTGSLAAVPDAKPYAKDTPIIFVRRIWPTIERALKKTKRNLWRRPALEIARGDNSPSGACATNWERRFP